MRFRALANAVSVAACLEAPHLEAQLATAGESGVAMGQIHVLARDLEAQ